MLKERDQQNAKIKEELERREQELRETKTELTATLRVMEKSIDREVELKLKLRDLERIILEKDRTIEKQNKIIQEQDRLNHKLEDEKQLLSDQKLCRICCDKEIQVFPSPCGHLTSCRNCASKIRHCPVCNKRIEKLESAFFP